MNDFKVAMLGFGNVGKPLAQILIDKDAEVRARYGRGIIVSAITTNSRGSLYNPEGVDLKRALLDIGKNGKFSKENPDFSTMNSMAVVTEGDYDAVLEMTTLNIQTGLPAIDHIKSALSRGKNAVTANKGPIAWAYKNLKKLAEEKQVCFFFESTVMDGTPIFNMADQTLRLSKIQEIRGILNATTNFVLANLEAGLTYEEALEEGRKIGIVEADPSMDIDGHDPTAKIIALANVLMHADLTPDQVEREGISKIDKAMIDDARSRGKSIKLICRAYEENGQIKASVKPTEIPSDDIYTVVGGPSSVISITTEYMGTLTTIEHDATPLQTAYGVFGDVLRIFEHLKCKGA
jgi:homoserine dehydrogenase